MSHDSFYSAWASHYDAVFPPGPKPAFVARQLPAAARVLDLGCASGGMAFALAERGFAVHGVDLDAALVALAQARLAAEPREGLSFAQGDMLALPAPEVPFDAAICLGNTLVHLLGAEQLVSALESLAAQVAPGGAIVVQIVNYDRVLDGDIDHLPTLEAPGLRFERRYLDLSPEGLRFAARLEVAEGVFEVEQPLVPLRRAQLHAELRAGGWTPRAWFGAYDGRPWSPESFGCIVVAGR